MCTMFCVDEFVHAPLWLILNVAIKIMATGIVLKCYFNNFKCYFNNFSSVSTNI